MTVVATVKSSYLTHIIQVEFEMKSEGQIPGFSSFEHVVRTLCVLYSDGSPSTMEHHMVIRYRSKVDADTDICGSKLSVPMSIRYYVYEGESRF